MKSTHSLRYALLLVPAALLPGVVGCGGSNRAAVHGKVTFADGTPLTGGMVLFLPLDKENTLSPRGYLETDGSFEMATSQPKDGAPVGKYKVAVQPRPPAPGSNAPVPAAFDSRFSDFDSSGLVFEVKPGQNELPITVTKPGAGKAG